MFEWAYQHTCSFAANLPIVGVTITAQRPFACKHYGHYDKVERVTIAVATHALLLPAYQSEVKIEIALAFQWGSSSPQTQWKDGIYILYHHVNHTCLHKMRNVFQGNRNKWVCSSIWKDFFSRCPNKNENVASSSNNKAHMEAYVEVVAVGS